MRMALVPDEGSMLWLHTKEEFLAEQVYHKPSLIKGSIEEPLQENGFRMEIGWRMYVLIWDFKNWT
jgi:hypothetical protein